MPARQPARFGRQSTPRGILQLVLILWLGCISLPAQPVLIPLLQAHAHNDYEHKRPCLDALDHGFCSIEADIHLVDGQLLVAHSRLAVKPERTLQALYLEPLREHARKHGGRVYAGGPEVTLLIDLKGEWKVLYPVLRDLLKQYADIVSTYENATKQTRAVRVIITGNRSKEMFAGEAIRYAQLDGDLPDLDGNEPADLIPWISHNWTRTFRWRGSGAMPEPEKTKLKEIVSQAHAQGRQVRFWGAPDQRAFWTELLADGVDLINTDDLDGVQKFLLERR